MKLFSNVGEIEIGEEDYNEFFKEKNVIAKFDNFEIFSKDFFNFDTKCKNCGVSVRDSIFNGEVGCPKCYNYILKYVKKDRVVTFYDAKNLKECVKFGYSYKGKKPKGVLKFFENRLKILELKSELEKSILEEKYEKCDFLQKTIDDLEKRQLKLRRKING